MLRITRNWKNDDDTKHVIRDVADIAEIRAMNADLNNGICPVCKTGVKLISYAVECEACAVEYRLVSEVKVVEWFNGQEYPRSVII